MTKKGISIHVGVNVTEAPGLTAPALLGCEKDAEAMLAMARDRGFVPVDDGEEDGTIIGDNATFENVLGKIRLAAEQLVDGDIFLFTFSGHGTRRGAAFQDEFDLKDETLVLHDRLLVDNVLRRQLWPKFKEGVRVVMVSDSCHSGGAAMEAAHDSESEVEVVAAVSAFSADVHREANVGAAVVGRPARPQPQACCRIRSVPEGQAQAHFDLLHDFYQELQGEMPDPAPPVAANVLLLAACGEFGTTLDGPEHGVFTGALLEVLDTNGSKTYNELKDAIVAKLQPLVEDNKPVVVSFADTPSFADTEAFKI